jgi:hypothetical protein
MTEQQRPDEEVEGHSRFAQDPDAPEGSEEEDTEGHVRYLEEEGSADDVAGHSRRDATAPDEGDDTGGHTWTRT